MAKHDWQALTKLTGGSAFGIERVRLLSEDIAIEGHFEAPPLAQLAADDQIFVAAFVRCHGSIKQMEQFFGVSYPTIKNRLNRIGAQLPFAEIAPEPEQAPSTGSARSAQAASTPSARSGQAASTGELLSQLERGTLSVDDVLRQLRKPEEKK
jgi:hypothetical protein